MKLFVLLSSLLATNVGAWAPSSSTLSIRGSSKSFDVVTNKKSIIMNMKNRFNDEMELSIQKFEFPQSDNDKEINTNIIPLATASALAMTPFPAEAIAGGDQIPSALAAYAHYLSLFAIVGLITYERVTVEADMSKEKEMNLAIADIGVGVMGVAVVASGYFRTTQFGKGWYFYSHEPIFWMKMIFLCIFGAASLFPTVTFIKRSVALRQGKELEPMSEKLAARLQQVLNAELVMLGSIPLAATFMVSLIFFLEITPSRDFCN